MLRKYDPHTRHTPSRHSDTVNVGYVSPISSSATQGVFTEQGFVCLGFGVQSATCSSGAALLTDTATCSDGSAATSRAAEFDFEFVEAGSSGRMPPFESMFVTFFDVDGDDIDIDGDGSSDGFVFEFNAVPGAVSRTIDASSTLEGGAYEPSGILYALSTQHVNVDTDFTVSPATPSTASLAAIAAFELRATSAFKVRRFRERCRGEGLRAAMYARLSPSFISPPPPSIYPRAPRCYWEGARRYPHKQTVATASQ